LGSEKRPFGKGIIRRIHDTMTGQYSTGLYINTNKTADQNKDELERGYIIPWQNEEVLYWLEKLRNWQEKYNPIVKPTDCTTLLTKHIGKHKSQTQLESMGEIAFLFRDASAKGEDKYKPICGAANIAPFWYQLLLELENQLAEQGNTLDNGERLKLVVDYPEDTPENAKVATNFPLHSLRVSLITAYTMDTQLPLPVISKLLAGHSRILMTIYYNKITPSVMAEKMSEAEGELEGKAKQSVRNFLKDASLAQIQCKMVYHKEDSIQAALVNRNPIGWEERSAGLCLVGGNTVKSDEVSTLGGCWNGGELIRDASAAVNRIYGSVPHGPENCIRCRWFITEARYLPALNAQFNQLSYKAHQAANLSVEIEGELEAL
ncbi:VPA1269 family protein, partial [Citrobacter youngae]